jgi:casein kinase II subunit alpha
VLQALDHTHRRGVIHPDVNPLNVRAVNLAEFYHPFRKYSVHVATRDYKSPELLMEYDYSDYSMDGGPTPRIRGSG